MNVEVHFTGLCAFVKKTGGGAMRVVLIDAASSSPCDQHNPALIIPKSCWRQVDNPSRIPIDEFDDADYNERVVVIALMKEDLVFPAGTIPFSVHIAPHFDPCPGSSSWPSFDWIARISEFTSDGRMRDEVLTDRSPVGVAARIRITSGNFSTHQFRMAPALAGLQKIVKFQFDVGGGY